jgi:thymidylate synthase (FAD)
MESKVEVLDVFGSDLDVVNAARVSFDKESKEMSLKDEKLLSYLARNNHISPFFHPQIRFRFKMPIFVAREWFRHTVGFARNEVSRRYVDTPPECWLPTEGLRLRDEKLKQGSKKEVHPDSAALTAKMDDVQKHALAVYAELLEAKVAPEIARTVLPQSMYTEFIETGSLAAYIRLCKLRMDEHAQAEIRQYAAAVADILEEKFPASCEAFNMFCF